MKKKKLLLLGIGVVAAAALSVLYFSDQGTEVPVAVAQKADIRKYVEDIGTVKYKELRNASVEGSGLIQEIPVDVGQQVKRGDLLLSMEKADLQLQLENQDARIQEIKATFQGRSDVKNYASSIEKLKLAVTAAEDAYALATDDYHYAKLLAEQGALSAKELKAKETAMKSAQAQIESAKIDLEQMQANTPASVKAVYNAQLQQAELSRESLSRSLEKQEITSPIDGVILEKKVEVNTVSVPGTVAFVIANVDKMELEAYILADDAVNIQLGDETEIIDRSENRQTTTGKVAAIAPSAVEMTSSLGVNQKRVKVTIEPSGPLPQMKQGYEADIRIITQKKDDVLTVPLAAVFDYEGKSCVFAIHDGKTVLRTVKKGIQDQESVEILEGLKEGETVLSEPDVSIKEGMKVKPNPSKT
ncbi:MAG: efflux RND transporter periplasmic adaptor subunit [Faecalispora jeddahensis]